MGLLGKFTKAIIITLSLFLLGAPGSHAGYLGFLMDGNGRYPVESDWDSILLTLEYYPEAGDGHTIVFYDFDLLFDADELSFVQVSNYLSGFSAYSAPEVSGNQIRITAEGGATLVPGSPAPLADFEFALRAKNAFDGSADIEVLSQIGTSGGDLRGILLSDCQTTLQYEGVLGPDVGLSPVPVPAAFWLFGSALIAVAAGRKGARRPSLT